MKMLVQGGETEERFARLLSLTRISSEDIKAALRDHLVRGFGDEQASMLNGVPPQNFNRALKQLNKVATIVEEIKEIDWKHLKNGK